MRDNVEVFWKFQEVQYYDSYPEDDEVLRRE